MKTLSVLSVLASLALPLTAVAGDPPAAAAPSAPAAAPAAGAITFDFADMKGVNGITFLADSTLEPITGVAGGISGKVTVNPGDLKSLSGELVLPVEKLKTPNEGMNKALYGPDFLEAEKYPNITVKLKNVTDAKPGAKPNSFDLKVNVDITLHGVTKEATLPISATVLEGRLADRTGGRAKGDILVLRSNFKVKRGDYNIKPGQMTDVVADEIEIRASIVGANKKD